MRRNPQGLGGPIQITPVATPKDTFVGGSTQRLTSGEIIDFTPFSRVLADYVGDKEEEARNYTGDTIRQVGQRVASGEKLDDVLKEFSSDDATPTRVKTKLAKAFKDGNIDPTANPAYLVQYYTGQGDIRVLAARSELSSEANLAEIAKAGREAPEGQATQAMLNAIRGKVDGFGLYEGMGSFGTAAIDRSLIGVVGETLDAAEKIYQEEVKAAVQESFGGKLLVLGRRLSSAISNGDEELRAGALQEIGDSYTALRASGEPQHRQLLVQSILSMAEDVNDKQGPEAAAALLDELADDLSEGTARIFDSGAVDDPADLENRARLLAAKDAYTESIDRVDARQRAEKAEQRAEVERQMGIAHGSEIALLAGSSAVDVNAYYNKLLQDIYAGEAVDQEVAFVKQQWVSEMRMRTLEQQRTQSFDDEGIVGDLDRMLADGQTNQALQTLNDLNGTGRMTNGTLAKYYETVKAVRETPAVYQSSVYQQLQNKIEDTLSAFEQFQVEGQPSRSKINPVALEKTAEIQQEIHEALAADGDKIRQDGAGRWVEKFIGDKLQGMSSDFSQVAVGKAQETLEKKFEAEIFEKYRVNMPVNVAPTLGGLSSENMPVVLTRVQKYLAKPVESFTLLGMGSDRTKAKSRETDAAEHLRFAAEGLDDFLTDPDLTDSQGNKLTKGQKSRAVAESIAYSGLSINELIGGKLKPTTLAKWATEDRPALTGEITEKRLDFSGVDLLNTPVEEAMALMPYITFDASSGKPTGLRQADGLGPVINRLQTLLPKFGLPADDQSVLLFVLRQYELLTVLRPDEYKKQ